MEGNFLKKLYEFVTITSGKKTFRKKKQKKLMLKRSGIGKLTKFGSKIFLSKQINFFWKEIFINFYKFVNITSETKNIQIENYKIYTTKIVLGELVVICDCCYILKNDTFSKMNSDDK